MTVTKDIWISGMASRGSELKLNNPAVTMSPISTNTVVLRLTAKSETIIG